VQKACAVNTLRALSLLILSVALSGCEAIKGIFKAGVWVGAVGVVAIVIIVALSISAFRRG
jgi:hypothetical protein